ncbi:acyltransferase family protein [Streptomyces aidingensis]|uniref:Peptidoglycan/LPS O-acetylase OafA/YrhL, contains acyltransferase and SGNH-hydrolase domains n=1 Tax=Streptomyces aidingensis TaxID=910347 RepID=A0A1I1FF01_9ACTN|nr:acyltransferase family protein [Streptomyces aidingensis]SFB96278.1 Peptidoglycan/LPS O-acetylase OafA/YrhL, contains acyltransferase and SGNH-hydrolase domains [Streptomyces aidingensis]
MTTLRGGQTPTGETPAGAAAPPERRSELDALRALVVIGLVFFHSALVFDSRDDFYIKNDTTTDATMIAAGLAVVWAMPLLFLIAGVGSRHSLRRRGPRGFAAGRLRRLGVPLLFALLVLLPVPQWLRLRAADPGYRESYPEFWPRFFDVHLEAAEFPFVVQGEHFETGHLWFVALLLSFALLLALPAALLPPGRGAALLGAAAGAATRRRGLLLLAGASPLALISALLGLEEGYGGWHRLAYLLFFGYGLAVVSDERFRAVIRRDAARAAVLAGALFALGMPGFLLTDEPFTEFSPLAVAARGLYGATGWCAVVAILGLLDRGGRAAAASGGGPAGPLRDWWRRVSGYLGDAVLPLYVLHQPIVVAVAYGVVGRELPMVVKFLVISLSSLLLTVAAYELLVRRTRPARFLFGMR